MPRAQKLPVRQAGEEGRYAGAAGENRGVEGSQVHRDQSGTAAAAYGELRRAQDRDAKQDARTVTPRARLRRA